MNTQPHGYTPSTFAQPAGGRRLRGPRVLVLLLGVVVVLTGAGSAAAVTVSPGDILIADLGTTSRGGGVFHVNPTTGTQTAVVTGGKFLRQVGVAVQSDGNILIGDASFGPFYRLLRVDPVTSAETVVAIGIASPGMVIEPDGEILLAAGPRISPDHHARAPGVTRVDPATGGETTVASGGLLVEPIGLALEPDGDILVADAGPWDGTGTVIRVDPATGTQTVAASQGALAHPHGVAVDVDGSILVADPDAFGGPGGVIRVDPSTGAQTIVSSGGSFRSPQGVALDADRDILVVDSTAFQVADPSVSAGAVIRVAPESGAQTTLSVGGLFSSPRTIAIAAPTANDPPDCSSVTASPSTLLRVTRDPLTITLSGATDPDGGPLAFRIDAVEQDEPVTGTGDDTSPDAWHVDATDDGNQVRVRTERNPKGNGRVYRIAYTVFDETASCSGTAFVSVPRKGSQPAIDDGNTTRWDSFTGARVIP